MHSVSHAHELRQCRLRHVLRVGVQVKEKIKKARAAAEVRGSRNGSASLALLKPHYDSLSVTCRYGGIHHLDSANSC